MIFYFIKKKVAYGERNMIWLDYYPNRNVVPYRSIIEDGPCNFYPSYMGGSLSLGVKSRNKVSLFRCCPACKVSGLKIGPPHFQMLRPTPAVLFDQSLITTER